MFCFVRMQHSFSSEIFHIFGKKKKKKEAILVHVYANMAAEKCNSNFVPIMKKSKRFPKLEINVDFSLPIGDFSFFFFFFLFQLFFCFLLLFFRSHTRRCFCFNSHGGSGYISWHKESQGPVWHFIFQTEFQ